MAGYQIGRYIMSLNIVIKFHEDPLKTVTTYKADWLW